MARNLFLLFGLCCLFFSARAEGAPCREAVKGHRPPLEKERLAPHEAGQASANSSLVPDISVEFSDFVASMQEAFGRILLPESLSRLRFSPCGSTDLCLMSKTNIDFQVEITEEDQAWIETGVRSKVLKIPSLMFLNLPSSESVLKSFLVGHEEHPYQNTNGVKSSKPEQDLAFQAFMEVLDMGGRGFLHVAPTAMGKTLVLTKALAEILNRPGRGKIIIVTADRIQLIHQLYAAIHRELASAPALVVNWSARGRERDFRSELKTALEKDETTVFVITSQSLKKALEFMDQELYSALAGELSALFIDEAHHLGARQTHNLLWSGLFEKTAAFLYGATATPVHRNTVLTDLFERKHWSYLSGNDNLFENYTPGEALKQLSFGIQRGSLTLFDDLYILGESSFMRGEPDEALFAREKSSYVLHPDHYPRLAQLLYPIFSANKKGFIVAATIREAERLAEFLNGSFSGEIVFSVYHSGLDPMERQAVLAQSEESDKPHYIVAVRALDEGVDMPWLSAYVDLNGNISVGRMIHRMGRVLRLMEGKIRSDVVFLTDYRNADMARDLLNVLNSLKALPFSRNLYKGESGVLLNGRVPPISREDLRAERDLLEEAARSFWRGKLFLPWDQAVLKVRAAGILSHRGYMRWRKAHSDMPSRPKEFYAEHWRGWGHFLGTGRLRNGEQQFLSWDQAVLKVRSAGILLREKYEKWRVDHPDMPSRPQDVYAEHWQNWGHFLGTEGRLRNREHFLSWDQAVLKVRATGVSSNRGYRQWRKAHPDMPSMPDQVYAKHWQNWGHFLGTGRVRGRREQFLPWDQAVLKARAAGVSSKLKYKEWRKAHPDMPSRPYEVYAEYWQGWRHFLRTSKVGT